MYRKVCQAINTLSVHACWQPRLWMRKKFTKALRKEHTQYAPAQGLVPYELTLHRVAILPERLSII